MGRSPLSPDDWLQDDEVMLDWLEEQVRRRAPHLLITSYYERRHGLLSSINQLISRDGGQHEFRKLKQSWRRYKSDRKRGLKGVQVKLDAGTKQRLMALAEGTSVHETMSRLINEASQFLIDRRRALHTATQMYIGEQENSAMARLERSKRTLSRLKSEKHHLEAEICALHKELANILLILTEYEAATGTLAGADLGLNSEEKITTLKRRDELLDYYRNRVEASASLAKK